MIALHHALEAKAELLRLVAKARLRAAQKIAVKHEIIAVCGVCKHEA